MRESEILERETVGGKGPIGTKVRGSSSGKDPESGGPEVVKRGGFCHLDNSLSSFFFTKISKKAKTADLRKLFLSFGEVGEVFIPKKLDKWGNRFGFVKFKNVKDEGDL